MGRTMDDARRTAGSAADPVGARHCLGLVVVDRNELALAALDATDLRPISPAEVAELVGGLEHTLSTTLGEPGGPGDQLFPVTPAVLRLEPGAVLGWDEAAARYEPLGQLDLDVLTAALADSGLAQIRQRLAGVPADAVGAAAGRLERLGLARVERRAPEDDHRTTDAAGLEAAPDPAAPHEPRLLEALPDSVGGAARVVAYRAAVRSRRKARAAVHEIRPAVRRAGHHRAAPTRGPATDHSPIDDLTAAPTPDAAPDPTDAPEQAPTATPPRRPAAWNDHRTPVFSVYHSPEHNANLGLGMIIGHARVVDHGALNTVLDLRRASIDPEPMLDELRATGRQAIVLCSDYMWSLEHNLGVSREVKALNPDSIVVHGGPHAPAYAADAEQFLLDHPEVDVLVRGEGELTIAELLGALGTDARPDDLHDRIGHVAGISYRHVQAAGIQVVRTPDRPRATEMDAFPSPYLTGEFDDVDPARWRSATVETNRGCPYGCTFCDWGQATMSRIRKFSLDRVFAELEWVAARGIEEVFLADSNFGIYERDVEIAQHIASLKQRYGFPQQVICSFAKNTVKYTTQIVRIWVEAGICAEGSVALQTTDPVTLRNVERSNIKVEKYDALADEFRRHRLPIVTDLLMGLPGATVESFKADLQRCLDQDVTPRMMETVVLPNSPMNAPDYKDRFAIELDESNILVATSSYTREDFEEMKRLRLLFRAFEHFGLMRHLFRWLQHEHGLRALDVIQELDRAIAEEPQRYPLLTWVGRYFDLVTAPPGGWPPFYDEIADLLGDRYGLHDEPGLDVVLAAQAFLMPARGRSFPATLPLEHDYVQWLDDVHDGTATRPLAEYPPGQLVVDDPAGVCDRQIMQNGFSMRREEACDNPFWVLNDWELDSALARPMATAVPYLAS